MTHYDVLGVAPDAPPEELRRAYLRQARRHHPDRHASTSSADRRTAERRMRELNEAWAVLRDPERRAEYDVRLRSGRGTGSTPTVADRHVVNRPSRDFTPLYADDEDDDDRWRYEPDEYDPRTGLGRTLAIAPAGLVALGFGLLAVGLVVHRSLVAAGAAVLALGVVSFLLVPMVALFRSQQHEGRPADGGGRPRR